MTKLDENKLNLTGSQGLILARVYAIIYHVFLDENRNIDVRR